MTSPARAEARSPSPGRRAPRGAGGEGRFAPLGRHTLPLVGLAGLAGLGFTALAAGCAEDEGSIELVFPSQVARAAIRRLRVEAYSPDSGGTGLSDRTCADFLGKARMGMQPLGTPTEGNYECSEPCPDGWFTEQSLGPVPAGRQIIFVLAYASLAPDQTPILEGCADNFDSTEEAGDRENVRVELRFVIPDGARLAKVLGDRQVARPDSTARQPLTVEVQAASPMGGGVYVIPGVGVTFTARTEGFLLAEGASTVRTFAGLDGRAQAEVRLPAVPGTGRIEARADALEGVNGVSAVQFSISVAVASAFAQTDLIPFPRLTARPVAIAIGPLGGSATPDVAVLTCEGSAEQCRVAAEVPSPGRTALTVVRDASRADARQLVSAIGPLGVLPADLQIGRLVGGSSAPALAVLNARRADCQSRVCIAGEPCPCFGVPPGGACPCEGSEVAIVEAVGDRYEATASYTLTASNAAGMAVVRGLGVDDRDGLVVVARGRLRNDRPCTRNNSCRRPNVSVEAEVCEASPEACGCPPNETCECTDCTLNPSRGFCRGDDTILDLLVGRPGRVELYNRGGCQRWVARCGGTGMTAVRECTCFDEEVRGGSCGAIDGCGCRVPNAIRIQTVVPQSLVAGPLRPGERDDLVIPSLEGLGLVQSSEDPDFTFQGSPLVNSPVDRAVIAPLDDAAERERDPLAIPPPDIAWIGRGACTEGFDDMCPVTDANDEDGTRPGCLGVYYSDGQPSVLRLRPPAEGGCRRHALTYVPQGICAGRFNADPHIDIAVTGQGVPDVLVYSGDGRGGLLDPPETFALPAAGGGPLACADLDGDGLDDVAVLATTADGRASGVVVLTTGQ